jgi:CYTH domain-containing protein/CheY-like chemotaxis protein
MGQPARLPIVIVAEDDPIARSVVVAEVTRAGYIATAHGDGLSALEYLDMDERADALVTGVHMPGSIDGLFLAVEARAQRPYLPVVYIAARPVRAQSMVPGARFLTKPSRIGDLVGLLNGAMGAAAARMMAETWMLRTWTARRFLVAGDGWMEGVTGWRDVTDGMLSELYGTEVHVRREGERAWLTVIGPRDGPSRMEFEYGIPLAQAEVLLGSGTAGVPLDGIRHAVPHGAAAWHLDVYRGRLAGIVIAEVGMRHGMPALDLPSWIGCEVTDDVRFGRMGLQCLSWQRA